MKNIVEIRRIWILERTRAEILKENIEVFKDTRERSKGIYFMETDELIKNTIVWEGAEKLKPIEVDKQEIEFVNEFTVNTGINHANQGYHTAVLNFADGNIPGGLVLKGETTQEESICRATNLYEALLRKECIENYYIHNQVFGGDTFTSRLIYSKGVLAFKNDNHELLKPPVKFDVITIPFPLGYVATYDIYLERVKCILNIANNYHVDSLILGAIGCGVFGNSVEQVAKAFAEVLSEHKYCKKIVFAIKGTKEDDNTYNLFKDTFFRYYKG